MTITVNQTQTNRICKHLGAGEVIGLTTTAHGYPILHAKLSERNDLYSVVLISIRHNTYHPFVVWTMNNATGTCEGGDYCQTLPEAIEAFGTRR